MYLHSGWTTGKPPPKWLRFLTGTFSKEESKEESKEVQHEGADIVAPQDLEVSTFIK
jgi:hypothetical protein